jgi:hypothetical protein
MAINQFEAVAGRIARLALDRTDEELREFKTANETRAAAERVEALSRFGVPKRIRRLVPDRITDTTAVRRVLQWHEQQQADESQWCLALSAAPGTGKSTAAGAWLWMRTEGVSASKARQRWFLASEIAAASGFDGSVDALCSLPALVIDDLGTEYSDRHGFAKTRLDVIVDARYREFRPTLITTNLNIDAFRERFGERVADRLREGGAWFEFQAESMRLPT